MIDRDRWSVGAVWTVAFACVAVQLATAGRYGVFRDELYYLACADHLAWGYVDHPPLSIAALAVWRRLAGESVLALRVVPAVVLGGLVVGTARLTARFGGGGFARVLAALCAGLAPQWLALTGFWSMNAFDLALWLAAFLVFAGLLDGGDRRRWVVLGVVIGLGLLNKLSMLFLAVGLAGGALLSALRREWFSRPRLVGAAVAAGLFAPHVVWQVRHDWPTLEFIANAQRYKIAAFSPASFLGDQVLAMLPPTVVVWGVGLFALLFWPRLRTFRPLGIAFVIVLALLILQRSKPYYLAPAFFPLVAAGAVAWEEITARAWRRGLRPAWIAVVALAGVALAPLAIPVLPVDTFVRYRDALGIAPTNSERHALGALPQHFADRFGWPELAHEVARTYRTLPAAERERCLIVTRNYGQAGALRYYGLLLGLPLARSQHNSYYLWGPGPGPYDVVLAVGYDREDLEEAFERVEEVGRFSHPWVMPYENDRPIYACRGPKRSIEELWATGKLFI